MFYIKARSWGPIHAFYIGLFVLAIIISCIKSGKNLLKGLVLYVKCYSGRKPDKVLSLQLLFDILSSSKKSTKSN